MKVCIVTTSLGLGGAERSAAMQSIMLSELGYDVYIVLISNIISFQYQGTIYNLGKLKEKNNSIISKIKRVKLLREFLKIKNFDFIIDNRLRTNSVFNEIGICKLAYNKFKVIYVMHSMHHVMELKTNAFIKKWLLKDAYKIVAVNEKLKNLIKPYYKSAKTICIENAIDFDSISSKAKENININYPYILYCGRLDEKSKNISLLIRSYNKSEIHKEGIKLIILGDGDDKNDYILLAESLKITDSIIFIPFTKNPFAYMGHAISTIITSHYEGFGLVLAESLATGTPVVSINCQTGPSEIVQNEVNGLLVNTYDENEWALVFKRLINEDGLIESFKKHAIVSIEMFKKEIVAKKWQKIIEEV